MSATPFGRYLLLEELAKGGMAVVFRAVLREGSGFEKQVALKRMLRDLSDDPEFLTRFTDEARIVSTLSHANIAQVFDFGEVRGEYFLAMELIDGPDLGTLLDACRHQGQPVPIPTGVHILAEMTRGLGVAHGRTGEDGCPAPVVHRDVSPQNVLISRNGEVKVVDFGIAKAADKALKTRTGMIMGKCRHMAPEQALGHPVDSRADVFASGTVLFEVLTGRPLFQGTSANEVLQQVLDAPVPPASSINADVPPELDEILARALARPPEGRYPDGTAMARDLQALLHRMAPDFTSDDLAQFVSTMVPAPSRQGWQAAATRQQAPEATIPDSSEVAFSATLASAAVGGADAALAPTATDTPTVGQPDAPDPVPGDLSGTLPPAASTTQMVDDLEATSGSRRRVGLAVGAALLALLLGVGSRLLLVDEYEPPMRIGRLGRPLEHHGWQLTLGRIERPQRHLLLELELIPPAGHRTGPGRQLFSLRQGKRLVPPKVASHDPQQPDRITLLFANASADARLRFQPPNAPPMLIDLEHP